MQTEDPSVPSYLICPLSNHIFEEPVRTMYGTVFDKSALISFVRRYHICPQTGKPLHFHLIFPDSSIKQLVTDYHERTRVSNSRHKPPEEEPPKLTSDTKKSHSSSTIQQHSSRKKRSLSSPAERAKQPLRASEQIEELKQSGHKRNFSGSSSYSRALLSNATVSPPTRNTLSSTSVAAQLIKQSNIAPPSARWFRRGRYRWKMYQKSDNDILEEAYQQGLETTKLSGRQSYVSINDRQQISTNGTKRNVIRGTYFMRKNDPPEWFPLLEEIVETIEQYYISGRWNSIIPLPEKTHFLLLKGDNDVRRYATGCTNESDYVRVYRGFPEQSMQQLTPKSRKSSKHSI